MVHQMAIKTAEKMAEHSVIEAKTTHIYAYGMELLFSSLVGVVALIIISTVCGKPFLWIPYLAGFIPLRLSGGGYHAKTHFRCIFTFSLLYSLVLLIEIFYAIPVRAWLIACLVNLVIILLFSPVAAPNKPLKECQGRTNRRNSLFLSLANLFGCVVLVFLCTPQNSWVNMYFAGSSMAGLSIL
ncbi:MAG: accessory gene regulator ArgB-like protein, partial [Agathobacter sp.]